MADEEGVTAREVPLSPKYSSASASMASSDMTYMMAADIYLGDVSSQVYEFLLKPRPCIFLNGQNIAWKNSPHYLHLRLRQVVNDVQTELQPALEKAFTAQEQFLDLQNRALAYTFYSEAGITAARRGAEAIALFSEYSLALKSSMLARLSTGASFL